MASVLKVDKLDPQSGTALEIGSSGDTITIPSGATFTQSGTMNASAITAGTLAVARGGTGTTTYTAGITEIDNWRITTDFSGTTNPISLNWERVDSKAAGYLGTGMSVSSGYWTFPSTGFWLVEAYSNLYLSTGTSSYNGVSISITHDDNTYTESSLGQGSFADGSAGQYTNVRAQYILDVTDTANIKCAMMCSFNNANVNCKGSSTNSVTGLNFFRLGDT